MKLVPSQEEAASSQGQEKGRITFSHGTAKLQSWLNCLKVANSHWINTAKSLNTAIKSFSISSSS